jgi:hypothetical protein
MFAVAARAGDQPIVARFVGISRGNNSERRNGDNRKSEAPILSIGKTSNASTCVKATTTERCGKTRRSDAKKGSTFVAGKAPSVATTTSGLPKPAACGLRPESKRYSNRENVNPFASASNASSESARTVVSGPQTIPTRIAELSSVTFGSRTGVISADIEEMLLQSSSARNREPSLREFFQKATHIDCAGFQLDLEISLSGGSSEGPAPSGFSVRPKMR